MLCSQNVLEIAYCFFQQLAPTIWPHLMLPSTYENFLPAWGSPWSGVGVKLLLNVAGPCQPLVSIELVFIDAPFKVWKSGRDFWANLEMNLPSVVSLSLISCTPLRL